MATWSMQLTPYYLLQKTPKFWKPKDNEMGVLENGKYLLYVDQLVSVVDRNIARSVLNTWS